MRDIEFRGKRKDTGEWVYGHGLLVDNATVGNPVHIYSDNNFRWREIIPETAGQYTGLKDKNGVKIFEGDILVFLNSEWRPIRVVVQWDIESAGFYYGKLSMFHLDISVVEVIGNIHDNPELLEVQK